MNGDDAAFPVPGVRFNEDNFVHGVPGLTKREYFAGVALQGLCASPPEQDSVFSPEVAAENAVKCADALLDALAASR